MSHSRATQSAHNIAVSMFSRIVSMMIPFIIKAIIINKLGVEYLGLDGLFASILQMLSLTELGFGSAMVFNMYAPIATGDTHLVCSLLNFYRKIYRWMGFIILCVGIAIMPFLNDLIASGYPSGINIYVVYLVFLLNSVISYFFFAFKRSLLVACMRNDIDSLYSVISNILLYIIQIVVLLMTKNYYYYVILIPIFTVVNNLLHSRVVSQKYPQYRCEGVLSKKKVKEIRKSVLALAGHRVGGVVFSSVDSIVIPCKIIATSNLAEGEADFRIDYNSLSGAFDQGCNSFIMLLKLLKEMGVGCIYVAGADGYTENGNNYYNTNMRSYTKHGNKFNLAVANAIRSLDANVNFLTPSAYDIV